jgi:hypothetical protein
MLEEGDRARYLLDHGADFIKLIATGAVLALAASPARSNWRPEEMKAACDEAKLRGSYCIYAHGAEDQGGDPRRRSNHRACELSRRGGHRAAKAHGVAGMDIYND